MSANGNEKRGQELFLASFVVIVIYELLEFLAVFFGEVVLWVVLVLVVEDVRKEVSDGLSFRVSHGVDGCEGALGQQLVCEALPFAVALNDAVHFPPINVIEKLTSLYAYLAHE